MRRVSVMQEFHGEPDMDQEGLEVAGVGPDEVTIDVKQGLLKLRVPIETPDNDVISKKFLDRFVEVILELEDGSELTIIIGEERDGIDIRLLTSAERGVGKEQTG